MHTPHWNILYRGPLSSCNYGCTYCPFAKTSNTVAELKQDAVQLGRFIDWVGEQTTAGVKISVLFTPWGEALLHKAYQEALVRLGSMHGIVTAAIQTNLSGSLDWLAEAGAKVALWCTFHPTETTLDKFVARIQRLRAMGVRHSVGVVGMREHLSVIGELRAALPQETYLWVNAYKREDAYYTQDALAYLTGLDPLFPINNQRHPSAGKPCRAGSTSFTVDGAGDARRCHFLKQVIGNIYRDEMLVKLARAPQACAADTCGCYIGYHNLPHLGLDKVYGEGILARIPQGSA